MEVEVSETGRDEPPEVVDMNIAILFDSSYPQYQKEGNYFWAARRLIFKAGLIQSSGRHMKMGAGDVIINGTRDEINRIRELVFFGDNWKLLHVDRLHAVFDKAEILAITFQNMTQDIAEKLHKRLSRNKGYLGLQAIEFGYNPHLVVFRNLIGTRYRMKGRMIRAFYSMGSTDGNDPHDLKDLRALGFKDVDWEDVGARGTIFDDYDSPEHFKQVMRVREALAPNLAGGVDDAFEMVMELEDLSPQLFNALGAAVDSITNAQHSEHIAQAALAGRRYMEQLADALFPARPDKYHGRDVGQAQYRNRLWAFVADNLPRGDPQVQAMGREIDRLVEELNGGLHGDQPKDRILTSLADAAKITMSLMILNPTAARQLYKPFIAGFNRFFAPLIEDDAAGGNRR